MKYGIFHYDYPQLASENLDRFNLGDYIQSLAAKQYFPQVDRTFDRDCLDELPHVADDYSVIVNGWYVMDNQRHIFNSNCLPVSIHINNVNELTNGPCLESLKEIEPIGCRDLSTVKFLESQGIKAYFSSCLTTTLDKKYKYDGERSGVIYSDVDWLLKPGKLFPLNRWIKRTRICNRLKSFLNVYSNEPVSMISHIAPINLTHNQRFEIAEDLINQYAKAKLVITSRIHAALPCIALGTPVILVVEHYDNLRYQGLDDFLNHVWIRNGDLDIDVKLDDKGMVVNNNKHIPFAEKLKMQCEKWVSQQTSKENES